MQQKLLLKTIIPHTIRHGKSIRKLSNNYLLGGWKVYNDAHHAWLNAARHMIHEAYANKLFGHVNEAKYHLSLGFYKGKSSKRFDISNFSLLLKWVEDVLVQITPLPDDSYAYITEARCVYLGPSESGDEECWVQLTKDDNSQRKYKVLSEYIPDWFRCIDLKTGGTCIVHRSQL